jgi:predicted O-linked N-acetylglucosamine transferase (SPINDLY family)
MTLDALACGLPVVTLPTSVMRGRMSAAMLRRIEVTETIATSTDHYIEIAVKLGLETPLREALKQKITARCSLLFNDRECITALEQFYQEKAHQTIL